MQVPFQPSISNASSIVPGSHRQRAVSSVRSIDVQREIKYEVLIEATEFGTCNYLLMAFIFIGGHAVPFEMTSISFVIPAAQCGLKLSYHQKGALNSGAYMGSFLGSFFAGYLCDTLGRQKILIVSYFLNALIVGCSGLSSSFSTLYFWKIAGGFIISGAMQSLVLYMSEMQSRKHRGKGKVLSTAVVSTSALLLPLMAMGILGVNIKFEGLFSSLDQWNFFLIACSLPSLLSSVLFIFLPESPKFLMTLGRNQKALKVLRNLYACNTGKKRGEYPIFRIMEDAETRYICGVQNIILNTKEAFEEFWMLCLPPFLRNFSLVCTIQALNMFNVQTLRLWIPSIFQAISDYEHYHNGTEDNFCVMLKMINPPLLSCEFIYSTTVYVHVLVTVAVTIIGYLLGGFLMAFIDKTIVLCVSSIIGGGFTVSLYFAPNTLTVIVLLSGSQLCGGISLNIIFILAIDLFPKTLRSISLFSVAACGKLGAVMGNLIFPCLLQIGCAPPFAVVGTSAFLSCVLTILLPRTTWCEQENAYR